MRNSFISALFKSTLSDTSFSTVFHLICFRLIKCFFCLCFLVVPNYTNKSEAVRQ
uniref:Uncharacterized protein n=1 Tax=Anguilla anguilla TaxID=7936 RepID=A0A0E9VN76_ANGAN